MTLPTPTLTDAQVETVLGNLRRIAYMPQVFAAVIASARQEEREATQRHQRHCYPPERNDDKTITAYCGATHDCPTAESMDDVRAFGVCVVCHSRAMEDTRRREREQIAEKVLDLQDEMNDAMRVANEAGNDAMYRWASNTFDSLSALLEPDHA